MKNKSVFLVLLLSVFYFMGAFDIKDDSYQKIIDSAPIKENQFVDIVDKYVKRTQKANNDMQIAALKTDRAPEICSLLKGNLNAINWTGKIVDLNSNGDGKGVIVIALTKEIHVRTWNNAFSDSGNNTLINQETALFKSAVSLEKGQLVKFSGSFISDRDECIREISVTQNGSMEEPEFLFRFSDISLL
ncbi:hypothetical protein KKI90_21645 [Xenorhabdus bovienii]|uniref:hypothetical protein n=1 Tax=Xenorhabdus bovienii TaxID=40576 RepID=UPI00237C64EE|nr:hypothetical protein [Xenorhabdus bovienii]MDE1488576.1 hypothetical protein [Xenorhabdus bovienii]MDE9479721.1 hypothetical protein [Xenorhabdus bovienii]MDE9532351.1 hypothetical protein [Xenorhabdus bovienii]